MDQMTKERKMESSIKQRLMNEIARERNESSDKKEEKKASY
jgi:hypothetical protein